MSDVLDRLKSHLIGISSSESDHTTYNFIWLVGDWSSSSLCALFSRLVIYELPTVLKCTHVGCVTMLSLKEMLYFYSVFSSNPHVVLAFPVVFKELLIEIFSLSRASGFWSTVQRPVSAYDSLFLQE